MEYPKFRQTLEGLLLVLAPRIGDQGTREVRGYLDPGEEELAVDYLATLLTGYMTPITEDEHQMLAALFDDLGQRDGSFAPFLFNGSAVLDVLNVEGRTPRRRGVPQLRGGHGYTADAAAGAVFPADWSADRIRDSATWVLSHFSAESVFFPNGRRWTVGEIDGVRIGVLVDQHGDLRTAVPLLDRPRRAPADPVDPPTMTTLLVQGISVGCGVVLRHLHDVLGEQEFAAFRHLQRAGEWEELADALAARLVRHLIPAGQQLYLDARMMLCGFDLPVPGCEFINDRAAILSRLSVA